MQTLKNDRFLRAARCEPVDTIPIWLMRQAGRYLPEYRILRQKAGSFLALCKTPDLACQVTLQPLERFPLDAAILFSDILTIPDAMGLGLFFKEGEGPEFLNPLRCEQDIHALSVPDPEISLPYVLETVRLVQQELAGRLPLIGFCGSPWTLACYMIEGKAKKGFPTSINFMQSQPALLHCLLNKLANAVGLHLCAQINAGVQAVMLFDTWGNLLNTTQYQQFSLSYIQEVARVVSAYSATTPIIVFTKQGGDWLELIAETGCQVIGVDWMVNLSEARQRVKKKVALQGNLSPSLLYHSPSRIRAEVKRIIDEYGQGPGHIFNLAHGVPQNVPLENISILIEAVHEYGFFSAK